MTERAVGNLDEVLDNLGVFRCRPEDLVATCPSGFRRVPIATGPGYYLSLQGFAPNQVAYAHTHPDSEEWVVVLTGTGRALFAEAPVPLSPGVVVGRGASHPHGFVSGPEGLHLLSLQLPRPAEARTSWDQPGETTPPIRCAFGGTCRRCPRCGGHSASMPGGRYSCENCALAF
ncbi:MAG TPA: cupin domain-containing protein [Actinomycetota bacterium]|nr:cupin domain-containing protein [Actinomycetota bacterium]